MDNGTGTTGSDVWWSDDLPAMSNLSGLAAGPSDQGGHDGQAVAAVASLQTLSLESSPSPAVSLCKREETWVCTICHSSIPLSETAQVKGCEHPYCANCILQWASYKEYPWCPQCRTPFTSLYLYKALDGSLSDLMIEESVCLLLRAPWFKPVEIPEEVEPEDPYADYDDYDEDEYYQATLRIGNRRWGENGYVRGGRLEARVTLGGSGGNRTAGTRSSSGQGRAAASASAPTASSSKGHGNEASKEGMGRRAKRAQKRELADGTGSSGANSAGHGTRGHRGKQRQGQEVR